MLSWCWFARSGIGEVGEGGLGGFLNPRLAISRARAPRRPGMFSDHARGTSPRVQNDGYGVDNAWAVAFPCSSCQSGVLVESKAYTGQAKPRPSFDFHIYSEGARGLNTSEGRRHCWRPHRTIRVLVMRIGTTLTMTGSRKCLKLLALRGFLDCLLECLR